MGDLEVIEWESTALMNNTWKKRLKRRVGVLLLACMLSVSGCSNASDDTGDTKQSIVCVKAGDSLGSGVIYEKTEDMLIIATAAHVLEQENCQVEITFYDDLTVQSSSSYVSASADLAFINLPLSALSDEQAKNYKPVKVNKEAFDALQNGAEVEFYGAEKSTMLESWIYVEDFQQYMMLMQGTIYPGMSGGGVFDTEGNFLGILCGANEAGEVAAVPLSIIQAEYAGVY